MSKKLSVVILVVFIVCLLASCTAKQEIQENQKSQDISVSTDNVDSEEVNSQDDTVGNSDTDGLQSLSDFVQTLEDMGEFISEGAEKVNDHDLNMAMLEYKLSYTQPNMVLVNFEVNGAGWEQEIEDTEYDMYTVSTTILEGSIYIYSNIAYTIEDKSNPIVETRMFYDGENNIYENHVVLDQPTTTSRDQYYIDKNGALYIVGSQLTNETLYLNILYYDGSIVKAAGVFYDNKTQLEIPYDFYQQRPTSFEDIMTEDSYHMTFSYDGIDYEYENIY